MLSQYPYWESIGSTAKIPGLLAREIFAESRFPGLVLITSALRSVQYLRPKRHRDFRVPCGCIGGCFITENMRRRDRLLCNLFHSHLVRHLDLALYCLLWHSFAYFFCFWLFWMLWQVAGSFTVLILSWLISLYRVEIKMCRGRVRDIAKIS